MNNKHVEDLIIIGSGPAGFTAALYAARAELKPLVLAGAELGGQLMITTDVDNYPGFPDGVMGPEMMELFQKQAEKYGARIEPVDVTKVDLTSRPFRVWTADEEYTADSVIVSTGASAKWLDVPGETKYRGLGVSACATCDGFFFRNKQVVVVGGGDVAIEEATFLTRFATSVTVVHRRDELRASKSMQARARNNPKIKFVWDSVVEEVLGEASVTGVRLKNLKTGDESVFDTDGLFVAIGHEPNTHLFRGQIDLDAVGYIEAPSPETTETNIAGVFAAGDVRDHRYRQAFTAAGDGCKAAMDAERWLEANNKADVDLTNEIYSLADTSR
ncbi:MAG: thioredoxin-disulfide reductase [Chloroflexia bacterium]